MVWMLGSAVAKEGVNGGEAHVSGRGAVPLQDVEGNPAPPEDRDG
jgi:hypothetical protein